MGTKADDIRSIATDGRYKPETKLKKLCERLNLSGSSEDALKDALNTILKEAVQRIIEDRDDHISSDDDLVEDAFEILTRSSKNWLMEDDTDLTALLRMMYNSDFYDDIMSGKRFIKGLESDLEDIQERVWNRMEDSP